MKNAIITIALVVLGAFLVVSQNDLNQLQRQSELVYGYASEAAAAGALNYNTDDFSDGFVIFGEKAVTKAMQSLAQSNLKLNLSTMKSEGDYFKGKITVTIYTLDDSLKCTRYIDGNFDNQVMFDYGQTLREITGETYAMDVVAPTLIVIVDTGSPRLIALNDTATSTKLRKMGIYEHYAGDSMRDI